MKAYYRKAIAEEKLNLEADRYATCAMCYQLCEHSPWLKNFMKASETRWKKMYKSCSITDADDFLARYEFAPTGRDRLSTMVRLIFFLCLGNVCMHYRFLCYHVGSFLECIQERRALTTFSLVLRFSRRRHCGRKICGIVCFSNA